MDLRIDFADSDGIVSTWDISDISVSPPSAITARCHSRNTERMFPLMRIRSAVDVATGEVIENVWVHFGLDKEDDGKPRIVALYAHILPAVQALKHFCIQVRERIALSKQERQPILGFILRHAAVPDDRFEELEESFKKLPCGDIMEKTDPLYLDSLSRISPDLMPECRNVAYLIARGSGRRAIAPEVEARINAEFPPGEPMGSE